MDGGEDSRRSQRLADWLEGLGLVDALGPAGLPTYERDGVGRATWTDPRTGAVLDDDQLADLDRLLHQEGSEPRHAVPVPLVQIARDARLRHELLAGSWFTYETLAELRGASVDATRFAVHKAAAEHRLLVLAPEGRTTVPAFQLDPGGAARAELEPVLGPLLAAGMDPWRVWAWLTHPAALLGGSVPEVAVREADEAPLVAHAAVRLAERVVATD